MKKIFYKKKRKYKYYLRDKFEITLNGIECIDSNTVIMSPYIDLARTQEDRDSFKLSIHENYAWDGPSGPTIDSKNFMRGSLVHDAFYQLIRIGHLDIKNRKRADEILREICIEDGMSKFRSWYVYRSVRMFGGKACKPDLLEAP